MAMSATDCVMSSTERGLLVVESMVLCLNASMIDEDASIADDTTHGAGAVLVELDELLGLGWLLQLGDDFLLHAEHDALLGLDANRGDTMLLKVSLNQILGERSPDTYVDGFECVLDLVDTALRAERVDASIVGFLASSS